MASGASLPATLNRHAKQIEPPQANDAATLPFLTDRFVSVDVIMRI